MRRNRLGNQITVLCLALVLSLEMPLSVYATEPEGKAVSENDTEEVAGVLIDEEHFPDNIFRSYLEETFDTDDDGSLSGEELAEISAMDVSGMNIRSLQGIESFPQLRSLDCSYNRLSQLEFDVSDLSEIKADHNAYLAVDDTEDPLTEDKEIYTEKTLIENTEITTVELYTQELFTDTEIDEEVFPDAVFAEYVKTYLDTDQDGILSAEEAAEVTVIDISGWGIDDLSGISCFKNLVYLNYADNPVKEPDLSGNIYLLEAASTEEDEESFEEIGIESEKQITEDEVGADTVSVSDNEIISLEEKNDEVLAADPIEEKVPFTVGTPKLSNVKNSSKGKVVVSFIACTNASGYEVQYCRNGNFSKSVVTVDTKTAGVAITNLPKNKKYFFRVRAYGICKDGKTEKTVYSPYSNVLSVKVTKGVKEQSYSAKSAKSGKVKSCKIVKTDTLVVKASVKNRIASSDDSYYLCQVDPYTNKRIRTIKAVGKTNKVAISLPVKDDSGTNLIEGKYALFIKNRGKYKIITDSVYISNPESAATYTAEFPKADSKKGLQGAVGKTELGVSHTLINIPLTDVIARPGEGVAYAYNGKTYYFNPSPYTGVISYCNQQNVTISAVFLLPWDENLKSLITPKGRIPYAANYYAWNTSSKEARETLEAAFMYLAEKYSRENCHLDNWILGNEVNAGYMWNYAGAMSYDDYVENYAHSFRTMYYAVASHSKNARVYISLAHAWTTCGSEYGASTFMVDFNQALRKQNKNIKWNVAYHAYPAPLTEPAFWRNSLATEGAGSRYVNLKNINILTKFVKRNFGKKTRIILSEQGFTCTAGNDIQAAAIAYGYYIAEFNDMIDSFIIRSGADNQAESAQGLKMGLCDINGKPRQAYKVFKYMDTPQYAKYTAECLKTLNQSDWKNLVKGFNPSKLKAMPQREN